MLAAGVASAQVGSLINYGATIKDSLRLENAASFVRLPSDGSLRWGDDKVGMLVSAGLTVSRTWTLPDESGIILTSARTFSGDVSGVYNNLQLGSGVVGTSEIADDAVTSAKILDGTIATADLADGAVTGAKIADGTIATADLADGAVTSTKIADGTITNADISSTAGIDVSKLAVTQNNLIVGSSGNVGSLLAPPGSGSGQVLTWTGSGIAWQAVSGTVPSGTSDGQLLRWNGTSNQWEAVGLSAGSGISISNTSGGITITNTGDTDPSNDLTTTTTFDEATGSDATVSGTYNALDIQLNAGSVGSSEIADGAVTYAKLQNATGPNRLLVSSGSPATWGELGAPTASGQVLTYDGSTLVWQAVSGTVPSGTSDGQLLRWNGTSSQWEAVGLSAGSGIGISNTSSGITITNTGDTDPSNDLTTTTTFGGDVSGVYNNLQLGSGVVGTSEIADGSITDEDISSTAGIDVSKLAAGSNGQVLVTQSGAPTWANVSTVETDPQVGTLSTGQVAFWDGTNNELTGSSNLYWDNTNNRLGIGTSSPQAGVHVDGSNVQFTNSTTGSSSTDGYVVELSGSDVQLRQNENASIQFRTNAGGGTDTVKMHLTADGRLVFYTPSSGSLYRIDLPNNSGLGVGRLRAQGYANYSSRAWKEDIQPIAGALEKVLALQGVQYRWKPEYCGTRDIGFVMEDVAPVVPEVVDRHPQTGELTGMDYSRLTALLVEALKEEHRRNEELRARVEEQNHRNEELRAELAQLRTMIEQLAAGQPITAGASTITVPVTGDWLGQNVPNPHDGTTTIPYYVPSGVGRAQLEISDAAGRTVRTVELPARDMWGQVTLDMSLFTSGTYEYRLVFDGRLVATKQMQLVK